MCNSGQGTHVLIMRTCCQIRLTSVRMTTVGSHFTFNSVIHLTSWQCKCWCEHFTPASDERMSQRVHTMLKMETRTQESERHRERERESEREREREREAGGRFMTIQGSLCHSNLIMWLLRVMELYIDVYRVKDRRHLNTHTHTHTHLCSRPSVVRAVNDVMVYWLQHCAEHGWCEGNNRSYCSWCSVLTRSRHTAAVVTAHQHFDRTSEWCSRWQQLRWINDRTATVRSQRSGQITAGIHHTHIHNPFRRQNWRKGSSQSVA